MIAAAAIHSCHRELGATDAGGSKYGSEASQGFSFAQMIASVSSGDTFSLPVSQQPYAPQPSSPGELALPLGKPAAAQAKQRKEDPAGDAVLVAALTAIPVEASATAVPVVNNRGQEHLASSEPMEPERLSSRGGCCDLSQDAVANPVALQPGLRQSLAVTDPHLPAWNQAGATPQPDPAPPAHPTPPAPVEAKNVFTPEDSLLGDCPGEDSLGRECPAARSQEDAAGTPPPASAGTASSSMMPTIPASPESSSQQLDANQAPHLESLTSPAVATSRGADSQPDKGAAVSSAPPVKSNHARKGKPDPKSALVSAARSADSADRHSSSNATRFRSNPHNVSAGALTVNQGSARSHTQQSLGSNGADDGPDTHTVAREVIAPLSGGPSSVSPDTQSTSAAAVSTPGLPLAIKPAQRDAAVPESGERTLPPDVIAQPSEALPPTPAVYSARVMERAGQSEMHVGVNSSDFGPIEVHAMVSHDRVGASISSGHPDLRTAIQMEMPSLNRAMESHQLRLEHFDVNARSGGQGGHTFTDDQQRRFHDRQFTTRFTRADEAASLLRQTEGSRWIAPHSARLSVIA